MYNNDMGAKPIKQVVCQIDNIQTLVGEYIIYFYFNPFYFFLLNSTTLPIILTGLDLISSLEKTRGE